MECRLLWSATVHREVVFGIKAWPTDRDRSNFFNERAARRSRSTSRFGCSFVCLSPLAHEQLRSNFKVQLRWLPLTESTQIFFVWLRVCLIYLGNNMPHAPRARGCPHVPFYEGMCQNLIWGTLATLEQLQSQITMVTELRIGSNFFSCGTVCVLGATRILWPKCATCTCRFLKARAQKSKKT